MDKTTKKTHRFLIIALIGFFLVLVAVGGILYKLSNTSEKPSKECRPRAVLVEDGQNRDAQLAKAYSKRCKENGNGPELIKLEDCDLSREALDDIYLNRMSQAFSEQYDKRCFEGCGDCDEPDGEPVDTAPNYGFTLTNLDGLGNNQYDVIQSDNAYIYDIRGDRVVIFQAYPPETLKQIAEIQARDAEKIKETSIIQKIDTGSYAPPFNTGIYTSDALRYLPKSLFVVNDRLIVLEDVWYERTNCSDWTDYLNKAGTGMRVYDVSDRSNPKLVRQTRMDGEVASAKLIDGVLHLVLNHQQTPLAEAVLDENAGHTLRFDSTGTIYIEADVPKDGQCHDWEAYYHSLWDEWAPYEMCDRSPDYLQNNYVNECEEREACLDNCHDNHIYASTVIAHLQKNFKLASPCLGGECHLLVSGSIRQIDLPSAHIITMVDLSGRDFEQSQSLSVLTVKERNAVYISENDIYLASSAGQVECYQSEHEWICYSKNNNYLGSTFSDINSTHIHRFHIDHGKTEYAGSVNVSGRLGEGVGLNAFGEQLSVLTTQREDKWDRASSNYYTNDSWDERGATLTFVSLKDMKVVGTPNALGRIYATSMIRDKGYAIGLDDKFEPNLYAFDLADPSNPPKFGILNDKRLARAYSISDAFIQPIDDTHLMLIANGMSCRTHLHLIDVSKPAKPKILFNEVLLTSSSVCESLSEYYPFIYHSESGTLILNAVIRGSDYYQSDNTKLDLENLFYVLKVDVEHGFVLQGKISTSAIERANKLLPKYSGAMRHFVKDALLMHNKVLLYPAASDGQGPYIYTSTPTRLQIHDLNTLSLVKEVVDEEM